MIYIILGMHKSGTTLVSETLHKSGINMGIFNEDQNYDGGNQYERLESQNINKLILNCGDDFSLDISESKRHADRVVTERISKLIFNLNTTFTSWGFKDPRTCLTYDIWKQQLPEHKLIFVYRSPFEVWLHYQRSVKSFNWIRRVRHGWKAISRWYMYNLQVLRHLDESSSFIIINYKDLMNNNGELKRLAHFTDMQLLDCRKSRLYRSKEDKYVFYNLMAKLRGALGQDITLLYEEITARRSKAFF